MTGRSRVTRRGRAAAGGLAGTAAVFAALGDETRLSVVARLCRGGPQSITELAEGATVSRQAVTKHLRALEATGLARSRRRGRERMWELQPAGLEQMQRYLDDISSRWDNALGRLRALVEAEE